MWRVWRYVLVGLLLTAVGVASPRPLSVTAGGPLFAPHMDTPSYNWSEYEVTGATFSDVEGTWNTQCGATTEPSGVRLGTWLGIGGEGGNLLQVGTTWQNGVYHLFTEWVFLRPDGSFGGPPVIRSASIPCGHEINAKVYKALDGSGQWCVMGDAPGLDYVDSCGNWPPQQTNAEWVDERPFCQPTGLTQLRNFHYTNFSGLYALSNTGNHTMLGYSHHSFSMIGDNGTTTLAAPDAPSSATSFTDRFRVYDPGSHPVC